MRNPIVILVVVVALSAVAAQANQSFKGPHPHAEFEDELGTCRQYVQSNAHWNHSTIWVSETFPRDRTYVSMNVTSKRAGAVKVGDRRPRPPPSALRSGKTHSSSNPLLRAQLILRRREEDVMQQAKLKSFGHGGKGENFVDTTFTDASSEADPFPVWASGAPFTGSWLPEVPLSSIDGTSRGKWTLMAFSRDGKAFHTPKIESFSLTFCEGEEPEVTAQGGVVVAPMEPLTKPVVNYPAPQSWVSAPKPVYTGPNLFAKGTLRRFWTGAARTVADVTANYNEANFYVQQVKAVQDMAKRMKDGFKKGGK